MHTIAPRAGRWPRALTAMALAALAACADEPIAPEPAAPAPSADKLAYEWVHATVTSASGGDEPGTLRWAVEQSGYNYGVYVHIDPSLAGDTITLPEQLHLPKATEILGPEGGITISGNDQHPVLEAVRPLTLVNVTITKGYSPDASGSAIRAGALALVRTTVTGNRGTGPAISAGQNVSLLNSTISGNVVGMPALRYYGGAGSNVTITHSTIAHNAPAPGIGVLNGTNDYGTKVVLRNSILAYNGSPQRNCETYYGFEYEGTNFSSDWECGEVGIKVADPLLQPLANNGGPNLTHAILPNSPAYNAGGVCTTAIDQRGMTRDAKCDVGAYEFTDSTRVTITIDPAVRVDAAAPSRALLTGTVRCTRDETFKLALELHQDQKVGKNVVDVHGAATHDVACGPTARTWTQKVILTDGAWQSGAARAIAQTYLAPEWVAPARAEAATKLSIVRR